LKGLVENEEIINQLHMHDIVSVAGSFYENLTQIQQNGCNKMQDQDKASLTQRNIIKKDYLRAFRWMKKAADMGDLVSMFELGRMYCRGHGVENDVEQGEEWFDKATIRCGSRYAERTVVLFHTSEDMQDFTLAYKWYKRLETLNLENNNIDFFGIFGVGLGLLYEYGDGVEQDYQKALECYTTLVGNNQAI
jgi:TPR repeat protein